MSDPRVGQNTTDTPGLLTIPETTHNARATKETDQIADAYQKLQGELESLQEVTAKLRDTVHHLSSASHLREAANKAFHAVNVLMNIPLSSYTEKVGAHLLRPPEHGSHVSKMQPSRSDMSENSDAVSIDSYVGANDGDEGISLPDALRMFAVTLPELNDAICDIESYRLFTNDYRILLVLHDKLVIMGSVISRFGHQDKLYYYILSSIESLTEYCHLTSSALSRFAETGSEGIKTAQARVATLHLNAATVATFLAGVTATTLQFSFEANDTALEIATNILWIGALALSIGSAMNSFLALAWRQSFFSSPLKRLSWWTAFWIRRGYLGLLIASCTSFLGGLICFTKQTQNRLAFWVLIAIIGVFNLSVICALIWFARDSWKLFHWIRSQELQNVDWVKQIRKRRRKWRSRPLSLFVAAQSPTGNRAIITFSHLYWQLQDILYDLSIPLQPLALVLQVLAEKDEHAHKKSDVENAPSDGKPGPLMRLEAAVYTMKALTRFNSRSIDTSMLYGPVVIGCEPSLDLQFSPNGKWLVSASKRAVEIFSVEDQVIRRIQKFRQARPFQDVKIAWITCGNSDAFCILGTCLNYRQYCYVLVDKYEMNPSASRGNDSKPQFVNNKRGTRTLALSTSSDLHSDFSWVLNKDELAIFNKEDIEKTEHNYFSTTDHRQLSFPIVRDSRQLTCCSKLTVLITKFDVGEDQLYSSSTVKAVYALAFHRRDDNQCHAFYVPLTGKILDVTFGPSSHSNQTTLKGKFRCHEHELLVSYSSKPPQLWALEHTLTEDRVVFRRSFPDATDSDSETKHGKWGVSSFVGEHGEFIFTPVDNKVHIFNKRNGSRVWKQVAQLRGSLSISAWSLQRRKATKQVNGMSVRVSNGGEEAERGMGWTGGGEENGDKGKRITVEDTSGESNYRTKRGDAALNSQDIQRGKELKADKDIEDVVSLYVVASGHRLTYWWSNSPTLRNRALGFAKKESPSPLVLRDRLYPWVRFNSQPKEDTMFSEDDTMVIAEADSALGNSSGPIEYGESSAQATLDNNRASWFGDPTRMMGVPGAMFEHTSDAGGEVEEGMLLDEVGEGAVRPHGN